MKKFTLIVLYLFIGIFVYAQKAITLLTEDFSSGVPPTGWTIDDMASQWSSSSTTNAGGTAPEAKLTWVSGTHTTHLISPAVDLTGYSTVIFSFKHFLSNYSNGYTIGVATRSGGGSWNTAWSLTPPGDIGPETKEVLISNADVGASDFQVALFLDGNFYNFNYWYIDDINLYSPDANDAKSVSINVLPYVETGNIDISLTMQNIGITTINSIDVSYQINSDPVVTETISGLNLATTDSHNYTFSTQLNIPSAVQYNLAAWVNLTGDNDHTNDTLKTTVSGVTSIPVKKIIGEEAGGTWCGWCPRGLVALKDMEHYYPDDWIGIGVHNNDPMEVSAYDTGLTALTGGGWPNGTVDRVEPVDPGNFENTYLNRKTAIVPVQIEIINEAWEASTGTITFDVKADFVTELNGTFKLNAVITEDSVTGSGSTWDQDNYYSSASQNIDLIDWEGINWKNLPNPVPAKDMIYNHVARAILGGWDGTDNSVPTHVNSGDNAVYSYSYVVPADQKEWDLTLIGFIIDSISGNILNAAKIQSPAPNTSDISDLSKTINIFPNPANTYIRILGINKGKLFITDISGKEILSKNIHSNSEYLNIKNLSSGVYLIRIISEGKVVTKKFVKN